MDSHRIIKALKRPSSKRTIPWLSHYLAHWAATVPNVALSSPDLALEQEGREGGQIELLYSLASHVEAADYERAYSKLP